MKRWVQTFLMVTFTILIAIGLMGQTPVNVAYWEATANPGAHSIIAGTGTPTTCTAVAGAAVQPAVHGTCPGDGGVASAAGLVYPQAVAVDGAGNIYIADSGGWIRKIDAATGTISVFAGGISNVVPVCPGSASNIGDGCPANEAYLSDVRGIAIAPVSVTHNPDATCAGGVGIGCIDIAAGDIIVADSSADSIRKIDHVTYAISTLIKGSTTVDGTIGQSGTATTHNPAGVAFDSKGRLFITSNPSSSVGNNVRMVDFASNQVMTVAGNAAGTAGCSPDSITPATSGLMTQTNDVSFDAAGNMYVVDSGCYKIRKITPGASGNYADGTMTIVAGNLTASGGATDAYLPATGATTYIDAAGVKALANGDLLIGDGTHVWFYDHNTKYIHAIYSGGTASGPAGTMALDSWGNLYWGDGGGYRLHKLSLGTNFATVGETAMSGLHFAAGDGLASLNTTLAPHFSFTQGSCGVANADNTVDCVVNTSYTSAAGGAVFEPVTVTSGLGSNATVWLTNSANPVCVAPAVAGQTVTLSGASVAVTLGAKLAPTCNANLLAQATETAVSYNVVSGPTSGTLSGTGANLTYTPSGAPVADSFTYTASITVPATATVSYDGGASTVSVPTFTTLTSEAATVTIDVPVPAVDTATVISHAPSEAYFGQNVTLMATVWAESGSNAPTGSVVFTIDDVEQRPVTLIALGGGLSIAQLTVTMPAVGSHNVSAAYEGIAGSFNASSGSDSFTVFAPTNPVVTLAADKSSIAVGGSGAVSLTATVLPGAYPVSSGIVVTGDVSALGGAANQAFINNGDGTFSFSGAVDTRSARATNVTVTVSDAQSRGSLSNTVVLKVVGPTADSVTPTGGSGNTTFTFKFSDPSGYATLTEVQGIINATISYGGGCAFTYIPTRNSIYLFSDDGSTRIGSGTVGVSGVIANSQCSINAAAATVSGSGNQLTLTLPVSFADSFMSQRNIYGHAANAVARSGWQQLGTWTPSALVPAAVAPTVDSVTPKDSKGIAQNLTFQYSSVNGYAFIDWVQGIINSSPTYPASCSFYYVRSTNQLFLMNDAGTTWIGPKALGVTGSVSNSQCTIDTGNSVASGSGNALQLKLAVTATAGVVGTQNVYSFATDHMGLRSGWVGLGTWLPNPPLVATAPKAVSAGPVGPGMTEFVFASDNGGGYINAVQTIIGTKLDYPNSCALYFFPANNRLYLMNDAGNKWLGPVVIGQAGSLSNTQCAINVATSSASIDGGNLRLDMSMTYAPGFASGKKAWGYAVDKVGRSSWTNLGPFTAE